MNIYPSGTRVVWHTQYCDIYGRVVVIDGEHRVFAEKPDKYFGELFLLTHQFEPVKQSRKFATMT